MEVKTGVTLSKLCPAMNPAIEILERLHLFLGTNFVITSTHDGAHHERSYHWTDHAFDFREYPPTNARLLAMAKEQLPKGFRILLESTTTPHFHVEFHPEEKVK